ncbi:MAG TPA: UTP--glucose-1-phosphate uridylyltransferase [bacterium]|nr:UTP--glucose-1-phosphate uridylyltransferase [bacterium]
MEIKKAIIPVAGLGTRFLPLSKEIPKEIWPLVDKPILQYIVEEVIKSGIKEIIFVSRPEKKVIWNYFSKVDLELKRILKERKKEEILKEVEDFEKIFKEISFSRYASFSQVYQKKLLGDGHAIYQAKKKVKREAVAVLFGDDVIESKKPVILQMIEVFKKYQKPIIALYPIEKERISSYGVVAGNEIEKRIFKIEKIIEKPKPEEAPSNLAIVGRYILTPEVFEYLRKAKVGKTGEIHLSEAFQKMIEEGKEILGYQFEGKWLECGNKVNYLKCVLYLSLKHPKFGDKIKKYLDDILKNM